MSSFDLFGNPVASESPSLPDEGQYGTPAYALSLDEVSEGASVEDERQPSRSFAGLLVVVIAIVAVLAGQTFNLQVLQGAANRSQAEVNSVRLISVPADRGLITDMNGTVLAQNSRQLALAIDPQALPARKADRDDTYAKLRQIAGIDDKTIALIEENRLKSPDVFTIKGSLSKDDYLLYKERFAGVKGVVVREDPMRLYGDLPSLGHLLGYVGGVNEEDVRNGFTLDQKVGKAGLEETYNAALSGQAGKEKVEVNAQGEVVRNLPGGADSQAKPGQTLKLAIDSRLQKIVGDALAHELARRTVKLGALPDLGASAVVLDPGTGAIRAMVSLPDYSAQLFAGGISSKDYQALLDNPGKPLLNRAIQAELPSGSVIKPLIAAGGLQEGVITPSTSVATPEQIKIGTFVFPDWKFHTGTSDVRRAIAESNDTFFYALGGGAPGIISPGLGIDRLNTYLRKFGLGKPLGVDLPGEQGGLIADDGWKQKNVGEPWYIGDTYHSSIGQGFTLVTPLQMADATASIVNGGTLWKPQVAWSTIDPATGAETRLAPSAIAKDIADPKYLQVVREGMRQTVVSGSARPLNTLKVTSAGKTGTAEFEKDGKVLTHAWYTGFAPYDNPELVFAIAIEGGGESFYSSEPVAEEILRGYFNEPLAPGQKLSADTGEGLPEFQGER